MSRPVRILRNAALGLVVFMALAVVTGILVVRTQWFRNYVREKIVSATEEGTGGRVGIGSFAFDWRGLTAVVTNFVIHGNETAGAPPYLSAARVEVRLGLPTSIHHLLDIRYLGIERPQLNVTVAADGTSNVPTPKSATPSKESPLQTVVDLAVGHFDLSNGSLTFNSQKQNFDLRAESLRVQLWYDALKRSYKGEISMAPLYAVSGRNTPVKFQLDLPVAIGSGSIALQNGRIQTDHSRLSLDASLDNWQSMKTSAHIQGQVALADLENLGNLRLALEPGMPSAADVDLNVTMAANQIDLGESRVAYGGSSINASGKLQDPTGQGAMQFEIHLALPELSRLARLDVHPQGALDANGLAEMSPHRISLTALRIDAFGAQIAGQASLENSAQYSVNVQLAHLDLETAMRDLGHKSLGYGGEVSGPLSLTGDLKVPGAKSLMASARLSIAPGRGIPLAGRILASYRGDTDNLSVNDSYVVLPHSRLGLAGSLGNRLNVVFTTMNLADFSPLIGGKLPVTLGTPAEFAGAVSGQLASPRVTGHFAIGQFTAEGRPFDSMQGDVSVSRSGAALANGLLRRGNMQAQLSASLGMRDWTPTPNQPVAATASVRNADLADVLALAGTPPQGYSGALTAGVNITGTMGNPRGDANLAVANGTLDGEPFDSLQAQVHMADRLVTVTNAEITNGPSRAALTAEFHHPRDSFDRGQIHAHLATNQVDLSKLRTLENREPNSGGTLQANADLTGQLDHSNFAPNHVTLDASGHAIRIGGRNYGDFTATARTSRQAVTYHVNSDFAAARIQVSGSTTLASGYPTTADANIAGLAIDRVLALLGRADIPAKGSLAAAVHVAGTVAHPQGSLDATISRAQFDGEPIDTVHTRVDYLATSIDVPVLEVRAGASTLDLTAHYDHQADNLEAGDLQARVTNGHLDLAHLRYVQSERPGLAGVLQFTANASAAIAGPAHISPRSLNLDFSGKGLAMQGKNLGDLTLSASTTGNQVTFHLDSTLAGASIHGAGGARLTADYPLAAQMTVRNLNWKGLEPLLGPSAVAPAGFDAAADADLILNGPALRPSEINGRLQIPRVQLSAMTPGVHAQKVAVQNQGPVVLSMENGVAHIESLHLTGPETDVQAHGSVSLTAQTMQASLTARTDLSLLEEFDRDILSSGQITADATFRGTFSSPLINGKLQVQKASVHLPDVITGLSNANGEVDFNGTSASFRNLTGEVGGGKVVLSGFMAFSGGARMALRVNATRVRIRPQEGVSATADADLHLSGRMDSSVLSGSAVIQQITYAPKSDLGAILSRAAPAVQSSATPSQLLDNMRLDVVVGTSSSTSVRASVAQSLQVDANLHIQGTASQPGVTGRIVISEGKLVFLSSTYTVNTGTITFYNPIRIDPILDLSLETQAQGVDVTLHVTGPIDNMKLSYTSDPPIQFQEIVGLLAAGQTPTSDPNILANQPTPPAQSFAEMGESAVVGQALADPIANQLQRVFGITQFKIDPTFANGQDLPQAQLSVQQQVTSRITLNYSTPVQGAGEEAVSGQYLISRQWSATATRDQFGLFSIKVLYKRQFK